METENLKKYFWLLLNVLIAAVVVNIIFFVMPAVRNFGDSVMPVRTITVSADGKTLAVPDIAEVSFSVVTRGNDPKQIVEKNNEKVNAAIDFVKSLGIETKDIKTAGYHLSPDYRYDPDTGESSIVSYSITQTVLVKVRDIPKIGELVGGLPPLGVNQIGGIQFKIDEPEKFLTEARKEAFEKAYRKAATMAAQNGVRLGRLLNISEYGGPQPIPYFSEALGLGGGGASAKVVPTIEPGQEEVAVSVTLTYALR